MNWLGVLCWVGIDVALRTLEGLVSNYGNSLEEPDRLHRRTLRTATITGLHSARLLLMFILSTRFPDLKVSDLDGGASVLDKDTP